MTLRAVTVLCALLALPVVGLVGYGAMAFVPILAFIRGAKIAENSIDYSLQNTTRNALYLPTSREATALCVPSPPPATTISTPESRARATASNICSPPCASTNSACTPASANWPRKASTRSGVQPVPERALRTTSARMGANDDLIRTGRGKARMARAPDWGQNRTPLGAGHGSMKGKRA